MSLSASLLIYDIPDTAVTPNGRPLPNPSPELRRVGVRVNLSCWIVPNHLIPYTLLNELRVAGATWEVVKFDISEAPQLIDMAKRAIRREITSAIERARDAETKSAAKIGTDAKSVEANLVYLRSCRVMLKRSRSLVKNLAESAECFGIDAREIDLTHAYMGLESIGMNAQLKTKTYADAVATARRMGMDGAALAAACDEDNSVTLILAD